jgi:ABC-type transport system substrate-binding protein
MLIVPRRDAAAAEITHPVGTGPYSFVSHHQDGSILLGAFSGWQGRPPIGRVLMTFSENDQISTQRFLAGGVDVAHTLPDDQVAEIERHPGLRVEAQPRLAVQLLAVSPGAATGTTARALADPRVRRAMLLALDRAGMVSRGYRGNGMVATQYVHPVVFGYDPALQAVPYDPAEARRLLAGAGFAGGFDVTLGHGFVGSAVVDMIVQDLGRVGIRVKAKPAQFAEILQQARAGQIQLLYYAWACSTGDASDYFNSSLHSADTVRGLGAENFGGYTDPRTDELIEAADKELDPGKRLALLQQVQRRVLEALPVLPLTIRWGFKGVSSRVEIVTRHDDRERIAGFRWRN